METSFGDFDRGDGPYIVASATDISTGSRVPFTQSVFNLMCSDLNAVGLARAASASPAVPVVLSTVKRVLLLSNARKNVEKEPIKLALFTGNDKEQVTWRDAATGRIIAQSDFFDPLSIGALNTPGFGGRVYFPTGKGFIVLQAMPAAAPPASK
jgi:hypothetical protein